MNKILFVFFMLMGSGAIACTEIGKDFNGNALFDCAGVIINTGGGENRDPYADIYRKHRADQDEQRKFNERMRNYERTKPIKLKQVELTKPYERKQR